MNSFSDRYYNYGITEKWVPVQHQIPVSKVSIFEIFPWFIPGINHAISTEKFNNIPKEKPGSGTVSELGFSHGTQIESRSDNMIQIADLNPQEC